MTDSNYKKYKLFSIGGGHCMPLSWKSDLEKTVVSGFSLNNYPTDVFRKSFPVFSLQSSQLGSKTC